MLLAKKSVIKNLRNCCLKDDETPLTHMFCKSKLYKKCIVCLTNKNRILLGSIKLFGKMTLLEEIKPSDVNSFDIGSSGKLTHAIYMHITHNGKFDILKMPEHPFLNSGEDVIKLASVIYNASPGAVPKYFDNEIFLELFSANEGTLKFTDKHVFIQSYDKSEIKTEQTIDYDSITDFDYYEQKMGEKNIFYYVINSKLIKYKIKRNDLNLNLLNTIFAKTNIKRPMPSYMDADEQEVVTMRISKRSIGIESFSGKLFRLATKNIYSLKIAKSGKVEVIDKFPVSDVKNVKRKIVEGENITTYGIEITKNDNKKETFWTSDNNSVEKAIKYISSSI